uniref:Uncharacterized protein n=1 Tax=Candidatus Kentrum sp. MB TaxID=2138164 RepID=A0A450XI63_9GAMM|nr:MAG: hypothetical protein BECKMB1821G_GA0114241_104414 [Candidatus Kentron sp. MB]VFK29562.1 MAG: hypothetical protein BECKMB1821I_GA0114274_101060 [Candidatus Kentron sp. MB]VFK74832.1 MAG: hypothetical protein BECKMB1821H_GA0114242_101060 [Candidatus Kentron sp. MB]
MKPLPPNEELTALARRTIWFKTPEEALRAPVHFIAHVLTYGTHRDVEALRHHVSDQELAEAIKNAPPGVFDARSWTYWNLKIGRHPAPPLPKRRFA